MRARVMFVAACVIATAAPIPGQTAFTLREPTGRYSVGRRTLFLVDSTRRELATPEPDDRRQVVITIWYPILKSKPRGAPYLSDAAKYRGVVSDATIDAWQRTVLPVTEDAPAASGRFPVVLFSHGWSSRSASSSIWLSEVASHGFVAVGVDHPYMGIVATSGPAATPASDVHFPSSRYADLFYADDLAFVRRQLAMLDENDAVLRGALQTETVFASGHSSGHAAASAFAALYPGVRALISFDAGVSTHARERGLSMPLLLVRAEDPTYTAVFVRPAGVNARGTIYDSSFVRKLTVPMLDLLIVGTGHDAILDRISALQGPNAAVVESQHALIGRYTITFLQSVLAGSPSLTLDARDATRARLRTVSLRDR